MQYTQEIEINLPCSKVIELFNNSDNLVKWQPSLISFKHLSGTAGEVGARSKLVYKINKKEIEMVETITNCNLPTEFSAIYETKGVWNQVINYFTDQGDKTLWVSRNEFKCSGILKIIAFLMPGSFKKETLKHMEMFKKFAENS